MLTHTLTPHFSFIRSRSGTSLISSSDLFIYSLGFILDYRRLPRTLSHVYYDPLTPENRAEVDKIFKAFTSDPSDPLIHNRTLETWGRKLVVPESTTNVAKFSFHELCGKPRSAADYLEITKTFGTIFVVEVPKMGLGEKDMVCFYYYLV